MAVTLSERNQRIDGACARGGDTLAGAASPTSSMEKMTSEGKDGGRSPFTEGTAARPLQAENHDFRACGRHGKRARPRAGDKRHPLPAVDHIRDHTAAGCSGQVGSPQHAARCGIERVGVLVHVAGKDETAPRGRDA